MKDKLWKIQCKRHMMFPFNSRHLSVDIIYSGYTNEYVNVYVIA